MKTGAKISFPARFGRLGGLTAVIFAVALAAMTLPSQGFAQGAGDLLVTPTRVVLQGRERSAQLAIANKGSASATYRITIINMKMDETGNLTQIDDPASGQQFADKLIRYSPRQVTLKPGESQAVRVLLRKTKDLKDGEYRSHIQFRSVPKEGGQSVEQSTSSEGVQVQLIPIYGITIPVIVRQGETSLSVGLSDMKVLPPEGESKLSTLDLSISRDGTKSAFGDLTATYKPSGGTPLIIGQINRIAVYTPNKVRNVAMRLRIPDGVNLSGGTLHLAYNEIPENGGELMAESEISLP